MDSKDRSPLPACYPTDYRLHLSNHPQPLLIQGGEKDPMNYFFGVVLVPFLSASTPLPLAPLAAAPPLPM